MATVATLDVKIGADIKSFQQGMAKMEGQLKQVGQNLRAVGGTLSRAVTVPILGIGGAAIKAASDVEEMQAKFNTVFKNVGGEVSKELGNFSKQVNRSRYDLQGMAATFGDIIKPMGFTEESAADMSVTLTKLAVDLSSFNNMPMDEAVRRLRGTLIGAHENAAEFGVIINENTLKQELMRMGADKLTGAQKEQAKAQARMNLLLAGTTDAQGDATRTAGSFANQMRGLRDNVRDLGVQIGQMLLPYATSLVQRLDGLVDIVSNLSPNTQRLGIIMAGVAAAAGPLVFTLGGLSSSFAAVMRGIMMTMGLFNPYVAGIAAMAAIFVGLYRNTDSVQAALITLGKEIKDRTGPIIVGMKTALSDLFTKVGEWTESVVDIGAAIFGTIASWWDENGATITTKLSDIFTGIGTFLGGAMELLGTIISKALDIIKYVWSRWGDDIVSTMGFVISTILTITEKGFENLGLLVQAITAILNKDFDQVGPLIKQGFENSLAGIDDIVADFKTTFLNEAKTDADEFLEKFDIKGFEDIIYYALQASTTDIATFRKNALEGPLGLLVGADELDRLFGSEDFSKIIQNALDSSETTISGFKTESLLAIRAGAETLDDNFGATDFETLTKGIFAGLPGSIDTFKTNALSKLDLFKTGAQDKLVNDADSVTTSADSATDAFTKIKTEIGSVEALNPSFALIETALSGTEVSADDVEGALQNISAEVGLVEALAPSFATLRKALGGTAAGDMSIANAGSAASLGVKGVGDQVIALEKVVPDINGIISALNGEEGSIASHANDAKGAVKELYDLIPSELSMPEGYEDILDIIPDANETHRWSKFVSGMGTLEEDIKEASGFSFQFAGYIGDIETAWGKLVPKSAPKWMQDLSTYATDAALVVAGLESMVTLLQPATWTQAIATIGTLAAGLAGIVAALAPAIGAGIAIYSISRLFGIGESEKPWERMGITQEEWEQMNIESGANAAFISNLMGPGADLSWLTNPSGETPSWLQGLQNYQSGNSGSGTFGGLPQFGSMLSGLNGSNVSGDMATMGSTQTININLDGQQIATATVPYMAGELELYGTNY